jgi:5-methylcytosine-specific restriction endonuclease McrA
VSVQSGILRGVVKVCRGCEQERPLSAFSVDRRAADGRQGRCKACNRSYRQTNAEQVRAGVSAWARANPDAKRASDVRWRAANPEVVREHRRRQNGARRARQLGQWVEEVDPAVVWARDEGRCRLCGLPALAGWWHLEHLTPLVRGGEHSYANVAVAHPACNERKGTLTLMEFYAREGAR